jgi:hypothetical protein
MFDFSRPELRAWPNCRKSTTEVGFWCPVSEGRILVSRFMQRAMPRVTCLKPAVLVIVRLARRELAWINVTAHATANGLRSKLLSTDSRTSVSCFGFAVGDRAKGGRSFVGTCAMYENECRARRTQRGAKLILCDPASLDRTLAARPA